MKKWMLLLFVTVSLPALSQLNLKRQIPEKKVFDTSVVDPEYGIMLYEPLNFQLKGDSVRMCGTYACQSWVEDVYTTGALLHKGFYIDGQLKTYKNYYPNGNIERDFRAVDNYRSSAKLYYENGQLKSEIRYNDGDTEFWVDYNEKGIKVYEEQSVKSMEYLEFRNFYFDSGSPDKLMILKDKKKLNYTYQEYHSNGKLKIDGHKLYDTNRFEYVNHGTWKYYDESGNLVKEELWEKGEKVK
ncbi:MAG: toxin-antitoxin system YwqK family antitoxin [Bacteroidota bacterium]